MVYIAALVSSTGFAITKPEVGFTIKKISNILRLGELAVLPISNPPQQQHNPDDCVTAFPFTLLLKGAETAFQVSSCSSFRTSELKEHLFP